MNKASRAGAGPHLRGLPEETEIIVWEILVRLPPKSVLRCRPVCRAWQRATSRLDFLQTHHGRQPGLPIVFHYENKDVRSILALNHRAFGARLQPVARLGDSLCLVTSCDGLLILFRRGTRGIRYSMCNPATRQHAPLRQLSGFTLMGMYAHRPTDQYRLLLSRVVTDQILYYVYALGSDQLPRYITRPQTEALGYLYKPVFVRDSLHWYTRDYPSGRVVIVFDTISESFRRMRAPVVPAESFIFEMFEMDGTLGIYSYDYVTKIADIWVLQNYESEVWAHKYNVKLPDAEIKGQFEWLHGNWDISVYSVDADVLLLVSYGEWMFYVDLDGELVDKFHRAGQHVYACELRLKQTLVPHTFFMTLKGYDVNTSPFV